MKVFKIWTLLILCIFGLSAQNFEQKVQKLPVDSSMPILKLFWQIQQGQIFDYHTDGNYFFKVIYLTDENHNYDKLLGESINRLYIVKGEYGEAIHGEVYSIGDFYNIIQIIFLEQNDNEVSIGVLHGDITKPTYKKFNIP